MDQTQGKVLGIHQGQPTIIKSSNKYKLSIFYEEYV